MILSTNRKRLGRRLLVLFLTIMCYKLFRLRYSPLKPPPFHDTVDAKPKDFNIRQNGKYFILYNYYNAEKLYVRNTSISLALHGEYVNLIYLPYMLQTNLAPISYTIFAPGSDFEKTLDCIHYIVNCTRFDVHLLGKVTFHICLHQDHMPQRMPMSMQRFLDGPINCEQKPPYLTKQRTYRHRMRLDYPINTLRNVARHGIRTYYALSLEPVMYPMFDCIPKIIRMLIDTHVSKPLKSIFCLPAFKMLANVRKPLNKVMLRKAFLDGTVQPHYGKWSAYYNPMPGMKEWLREAEKSINNTYIFAKAIRNNMWNPICIYANDYTPFYDERYIGSDPYSSLSWINLLQMLRYDFFILDYTFVLYPFEYEKLESYCDLMSKGSHLTPELNITLENQMRRFYEKNWIRNGIE